MLCEYKSYMDNYNKIVDVLILVLMEDALRENVDELNSQLLKES